MPTDSRNAAQYVRMSTDMQRYSIENQIEAISKYAFSRGITIVRTYEDAGISGLRLEGRAGLKSLLDDVQTGRANFKIILVYDISRWGRFQDSDESAYYEYACRDAGVAVHYCAEQFENDGSLLATILKNIKRAMAGEYSRELSVKVFAGQSRLASLGFHRGATAGYSLRRLLVDERGNRKFELSNGMRKNIRSDRVILVPGPQSEINIVKSIYRAFVEEKKTLSEIARKLNAQGLTNAFGRPWQANVVRDILTNEKYIGNNVFNQTSFKLGKNWKRNPPNEWIRSDGAFEPIITKETFELARRQIVENRDSYTDEELLDLLTALWCRTGMLSEKIIAASPIMPSANAYRRHFGRLMNAYARIGFKRRFLGNRVANINLRKTLCDEISNAICRNGGSVVPMRDMRLRINDELTASIVIARSSRTSSGQTNWRFGYRAIRKPDLLIVARIVVKSDVRDYFVIPFVLLPNGSYFTLSSRNAARLQRYRSTSLEPLINLCARTRLSLD